MTRICTMGEFAPFLTSEGVGLCLFIFHASCSSRPAKYLIYAVAVAETPGVRELCAFIEKLVPPSLNLHISNEFHISLSKILVIRFHWISSFVQTLKERINPFKRYLFSVKLVSWGIIVGDLQVFCVIRWFEGLLQ